MTEMMHDQMDTVRRLVRGLYREIPDMRGALPVVAVSQHGETVIHPDRRTARAFARTAGHRLGKSPDALKLAEKAQECRLRACSFYNPYLDTIFLYVGNDEANNGLPVETVLRHELGHVLDQVDPADYAERMQIYERRADAFAVLHHLRENPHDLSPAVTLYQLREKSSPGRRDGYHTQPAIQHALALGLREDLSGATLYDLLALARAATLLASRGVVPRVTVRLPPASSSAAVPAPSRRNPRSAR